MNFLRFKYLYFLISAFFLVPGVISLLFFGLKPAIDFTGGTLLEYRITPLENKSVTAESLNQIFNQQGLENPTIQSTGANTWLIRTQPIDGQKNSQLKTQIATELGEIEERRFETIGPTLGQELLQKTFIAILLASAAILSYVAYRFRQLKYGVCAVLAMFHDSFILLGCFSLLGHFFNVEVDTLFVTAVLTILSFSVHDTIVVYDRIRESLKLFPKKDFTDLVNKAITETLSRSVNNSMTIIFMLTALTLLGGQTTRYFSLALLIGTITGTYSSTFTAAPLLVVWENIINKKK